MRFSNSAPHSRGKPAALLSIKKICFLPGLNISISTANLFSLLNLENLCLLNPFIAGFSRISTLSFADMSSTFEYPEKRLPCHEILPFPGKICRDATFCVSTLFGSGSSGLWTVQKERSLENSNELQPARSTGTWHGIIPLSIKAQPVVGGGGEWRWDLEAL